MSTRATYRFVRDSEYDWQSTETTIYVHYDGYESGAATYIYQMLCRPSKGNLATQFIRAVEHAEITPDHEIHGDTEYRYDIIGHGPEAQISVARRTMSSDERFGPMSPRGSLIEFVHMHREKLFCLDELPYSEFRRINLRYVLNGRLFNLHTARIYLEDRTGPLAHLRPWFEKGHTTGANWESQIDTLRRIVDEFPELATEETDRLLSFVNT